MFVRHLLRELDIDCVLDVGANVGQYGKELRLIGYRGHIVSFEPDPNSFAKLSRAASRDPAWHVFACALGSVSGQARLNLTAAPVFNSFKEPHTEEVATFRQATEIVERVDVPVERLDNILGGLKTKLGFQRVFLKMDTQGFDQEVLDGAAGIVDELRGFQSEVSVKRIYRDTPTWSAAIEEYQRRGFTLAGLFAVGGKRRKAVIEFDCYMVRDTSDI